MNPEVVDRVGERMRYVRTALIAVLSMLAVFLFASTLTEFKEYSFIGAGVQATNTITVNGEGEVFAVPDVATFTVSVQEEAKDVQAAQTTATTKMNAIIDYLKSQSIEDRDIKTADYSVQPKYEWKQEVRCVAGYPCEGSNELVGFTVTQTLLVKVRDTDKAGDILAGAGSRGVSYISGLSFTIDDEDELNATARKQAIEDAKAKAEVLADDLGVELMRIVGFSENGGGYPMPYYSKATMEMDAAVGRGAASVAPSVPVGENKIVSNVSVTYEVR